MQSKEDLNPSKGWNQIEIKNIKLIESNLLTYYGFNHAFFTKSSQVYGPKVLSKYLSNKNCSIHFIKQIHSKEITTANKQNNIQIPLS